MHIIAADVGGTKTRLVLADESQPGNVLYEARYLSGEFDGFDPLLHAFIDDCGTTNDQVNTLMLALPELVNDTSAELTNLPWTIKKQSLKETFDLKNVYFMNDFQASAYGTSQLDDNDKIVLNHGRLKKNATRVTVGAGTGLGMAWIIDEQSTERAYATEGGHIDFAPVDQTQIRLLEFLMQRYGHVSYERLLSGMGLVAIYEFFADRPCHDISGEWVNKHSNNDEAADKALSLFAQVYGAYIGNMALLYKPFGGIFITGGIAVQILQRMQSDEFINAYLNKGRMRSLVEQIAVYLVINERVGVLGAMSEAIKIQQVS